MTELTDREKMVLTALAQQEWLRFDGLRRESDDPADREDYLDRQTELTTILHKVKEL